MPPAPRRRSSSLAPLLAVVAALLTGCTAKPYQSVQPARSLDEIYALEEEVNGSAEPYELGSGDGVGQMTYSIYASSVAADHSE